MQTSKRIFTEGHLAYCRTPLQQEIVSRRIQGQTWRDIAEALGRDFANCQKAATAVHERAANAGYDPANGLYEPLPPGQGLAGVTTLYKFNERGEKVPAMQYVLGRRDKQDSEALIEAIEAAVSQVAPRAPVKAPKRCAKHLLTMYHYTDYHLAMYAHEAETGDNWDNKIAQDTFSQSLLDLMRGSPDSEVGVFSQGGDWCHYDSLLPVTPTSKHVLDADSRIHRMVELALDMHVHAVEQLLTKHKRVIAVIQEGNHDEASSVWLRKAMVRYFAKNPRVEVLDIDFPYYAMLHGRIMLAWHHGHKRSNKELPSLFASEPRYREMWGQAKYCYIHTGHYHKKDLQADEHGGAIVERHPTLAGRDAYAARGGWVSWRAVNAITYHETDGEVSRVTTVPRNA